MNDIRNKDDIKLIVDNFYTRVKEDKLIGPIFLAKIEDDNWTIHLEKMYSFWNTVLFRAMEYNGNPFARHINLGINKPHFNAWLQLFENVVSESFSGPKADEIILRSQKMGALFESKLDYMRSNPERFPLM